VAIAHYMDRIDLPYSTYSSLRFLPAT